MSIPLNSHNNFIIVGENIHATRVLRLNGKRIGENEKGVKSVLFSDPNGEKMFLEIPKHFHETQPYQQGTVKHLMVAIWKGVHGSSQEQEQAISYIKYQVDRQINAGANFLDLNVDEVSYNLDEQIVSMNWLVDVVENLSTVPPSIDSSNSQIIEAGLKAYSGKQGSPMINSVALERIETINLVNEFDTHVIITAASKDGMPDDDVQRVENVNELMKKVDELNINYGKVHVDPLVFPISVSPTYGPHFLDAVKVIRQSFGGEIHISGGLSNVSFGLPKRKLINDVFIYLCIQNGIDSGIIDPVQTNIRNVFELDLSSNAFKITSEMLLGNDDFCMNYLDSFRSGDLD